MINVSAKLGKFQKVKLSFVLADVEPLKKIIKVIIIIV